MADLSPGAQIEALLEEGRLDGGFIGAHPPRAIKGIHFAAWGREPFVLALPGDHPLTKVRRLEWPHLKGLAWVMVSRTAAPAFRQQFSDLARRHALQERIVGESERMPAVLTMVAAGSGATMVPQSAIRLVPAGVGLSALPRPCPSLAHTFAYRTNLVPPPLRDFLRLLELSDGLAPDLRLSAGFFRLEIGNGSPLPPAMPERKVYYFDNNATTRVAPEVVDAMLPLLRDNWGNPSSAYRFGNQAAQLVEKARASVAALLHADPKELVFTSCGTESNNAVLHSALATQPGKRHIITTAVEHSAIMNHGEFLRSQGVEVTFLPVDADGTPWT